MRSPGQRWRVTVRVGQAEPGPHARARGALMLGIGSGIIAGLVATGLASILTRTAAPVMLLPILVSTLVAGRLASTRVALLHGACAWLAMVVSSAAEHPASPVWHGVSALWVLLLLIEDMALIGRVGYVRQQIARRRDPN